MNNFFKNKYKSYNLEDLIIEAQNDKTEALEELISRFQKTVYATLYYLDNSNNNQNTLDLSQEVLLRVAKNIKTLKNPKCFKSWLNNIITNVFYDQIRKKNRNPDIVSIDSFYQKDDMTTDPITNPAKEICDIKRIPLEETLDKELSQIIEESIHKLPERFRLAIVLREFQGLSYEQIAKITQSNIGTVKSRIARARNQLQKSLKSYIA